MPKANLTKIVQSSGHMDLNAGR